MARWTIVGTGHEPTLTTLRVIASTSVEDHLFISWALYRPAQHEIWRIVRGKRIFCGYQYIWDTPNLQEQTPEGDTLAHWFYLTNIPPGSEVWYYLHAPNPPSLYETQGPLMHVHLLAPPSWSKRVFCATNLKGMFRTADFSPPTGPQPHWTPDNAGLPFLDISQACPDPSDPWHRRFVICHGDVYRMHNNFIDSPSTATLVLSNADALLMTGAAVGWLTWITGNPNTPGSFYVVFRSQVAGTGIWCLRTLNYGATWTAHLIDPAFLSYAAGNIQAGDDHEIDPLPPGNALYVPIVIGVAGTLRVCHSFDDGETWAYTAAHPPGWGVYTPRLYIDPATQSTVYVGAAFGGPLLYRTLDHGASWARCDDPHSLGILLSPLPTYAVMGAITWDADFIRVIKEKHIWDTDTFGLTWTDYGQTEYPVRLMHFRDHAPEFLYLAHIQQPIGPVGIYALHTIFVSDTQGTTMIGKSGDHAHLSDGGGDSIPFDCGGLAHDGILTLYSP